MNAEASSVRADDPFAGLPLLIAVPEAAKMLGISRTAAYRFASSGELPVKRLGRRVYVISAKLRDFIGTEGEAARGTCPDAARRGRTGSTSIPTR